MSRWAGSSACWLSASANNCAACSGCIRSWPTAARKRLLASLARCASWVATSRSAVRSATRCSMAELMHGTRLAPEQREYADVIHTSAQSLLLLVNDVLDISAIEAGKLQRRDVDFNLQE
ncbi:hypothetical protein JTP67_32835, partial [Streptomyces sp. S12]|nr:hypothetical protein [Streptomyces sp. S12]